jgi:aspartyl/asparaginyl-tRNA synthetase
MAHGRVYCFGPTFRAERSKTRRHLTEFWMVEPEMAFADLDDVMQLAEDFITFIVRWALEHCRADLAARSAPWRLPSRRSTMSTARWLVTSLSSAT